MDEPIGALDAKLREEMRAEIKRLHIKQGSTTIYVTHDQIEAMALADRIVIMNEGVLQQVGSPGRGLFASGQSVRRPVRRQPGDECRQCVGRPRRASSASVTVGGAVTGFEFPRALLSKLNGHAGGQLALGIRPEGVLVRREASEGFLPVETQIVEPLGSFDIVDLKVGSEMLRARTKSGFVSGPGEKVLARIDPTQTHFFDKASGKSLDGETADGPYPAQEHLKEVRQPHSADRLGPRHCRWRVLRPARPDGCRQDDDAAPDRRARKADRRPGLHRRRRRRRLGCGRARRGAGAAAIFALSALYGARESRVPAEVEDAAGCPTPRSRSASPAPPGHCVSSTCSTARPTGFPAARCSASRSAAPSCASRACS